MFEAHDKSWFHTVGFSCGPDVAGPERKRVIAALDEFVQIPPPPFSDTEAAALMAEKQVDILVDLSGFTWHGRPMALIHRPAAVQVNYLGYPGTLGAGFIDYLLADHLVIPHGQDG